MLPESREDPMVSCHEGGGVGELEVWAESGICWSGPWELVRNEDSAPPGTSSIRICILTRFQVIWCIIWV
jgi:hypothetical protein